MKAQIKYAFLNQWHRRKLSIILPIFIFYPVIALYNIMDGKNAGIDITSATGLSAFLFMIASLSLCIAADYDAIHTMFSGPHGYVEYLAPVPGWKRLLAKTASLAAADSICVALNMAGFIVNWYLVEKNVGIDVFSNPWRTVNIFLSYFCCIMLVLLAAALHHSYFSAIRIGWLPTLLALMVIAYVMNLMNLLMLPFSSNAYHWGLQLSITLNVATGPALFIYLILKLCKAGLLFGATAYIMERKINI